MSQPKKTELAPAKPVEILVIDDDKGILELYRDLLGSRYQVTTTEDWLQGVALIISRNFQLLILDLRMQLFDPVVFIEKIRAEKIQLPILVSSADPRLRARVAGSDVNAIIEKPFDLTDFEWTVAQLVTPTTQES